MTSLIEDYVNRVDFDSYEDFHKNFKITYPDNFNFGFDVIDKYAEIDPEKIALIWKNTLSPFQMLKNTVIKLQTFLLKKALKKAIK